MKSIAFIREITWLDGINHGTHNGYVAIPPTNKYYDIDYDSIAEHIDVHGGITLGGNIENKPFILDNIEFISDVNEIPEDWFILGFDTCHSGDNPIKWNKQAVINETLRLQKQLEE